jgi:Flp pilus assembly protein TadD
MTAETQPEFPHLRSGELALSEERWNDAIKSFQAAQQANPRSGMAWQGLSIGYHRLGRLEEAWMAAIQAWQLDPNEPDNEANLSDLARELGRENELARVLASDESPADALCEAGEAQVQSDRHQDALHTFVQALDLDPARARAWSGIGIACFRQGYANASRAFFEMAVRLDPGDEDSVLNWTDTCPPTVSDREIEASLSSMGVGTELLSRALAARRP